VPHGPADTLDFTSFQPEPGEQDGDRRDGARGRARSLRRAIEVDPAVLGRGVKKWRLVEDTILVLQVDGDATETIDRAVHSNWLGSVKIVAAVSPDVDITDETDLIWGSSRGSIPRATSVLRDHGERGSRPSTKGSWGSTPLGKGYPEPLEMDPPRPKSRQAMETSTGRDMKPVSSVKRPWFIGSRRGRASGRRRSPAVSFAFDSPGSRAYLHRLHYYRGLASAASQDIEK